MKIKKYCRYIHLWLSLPAGIPFSIICFTGAILMFKEELLTIMGYDSIRESPLMIVMKLHRWLMDDTRTTGKMIVGISTLFFIFILISGLTVYWPRKWKERPVDYRTSKRQKKVNVRFTLCTRIICSTYLISMCTHRIDVVISMVQRHRKFIFDAEVKRGAPIWKIVRALHFRQT